MVVYKFLHELMNTFSMHKIMYECRIIHAPLFYSDSLATALRCASFLGGAHPSILVNLVLLSCTRA